MTKEAIIPKEVTFYLTESDDFIFDYGALNVWTPFQAACVISGYRPGRVMSGHARVGIPVEPYTASMGPVCPASLISYFLATRR